MPYDERLTERLRDILSAETDITEQKTFGEVAFMAKRNPRRRCERQGGLIVRADPDTCDEFLEPGVQLMEMRGRPMRGWLHVEADRIESAADFEMWMDRGLSYARSLPPK